MQKAARVLLRRVSSLSTGGVGAGMPRTVPHQFVPTSKSRVADFAGTRHESYKVRSWHHTAWFCVVVVGFSLCVSLPTSSTVLPDDHGVELVYSHAVSLNARGASVRLAHSSWKPFCA